MYCENCGIFLEDLNAKFCANCGTSMQRTFNRSQYSRVSALRKRRFYKLLIAFVAFIPMILFGAFLLPLESESAKIKKILNEANEQAEKLPEEERAYVLGEIAVAQNKAKDLPSSTATFRKAIQTAKDIKDDPQRGYSQRDLALLTLATHQAQVGKASDAFETIKEISTPSGVGERGNVLATIAIGQAQVGDVRGALDTVSQLSENESEEGYALRYIATAQATKGDFAQALETAARIKNNFWKSAALADIAKTQAEVGNEGGATLNFKRARQTANNISNSSEQVAAVREIAEAQGISGNKFSATNTFQEAVRMTSSLPNQDAREMANRDIAISMARIGLFAEALQIANNLSTGHKDMSLSSIATAQAKFGKVREALATVDTLKSDRWKDAALSEIVTVQTKAKDLAGALKSANSMKGDSSKAGAFRNIAAAYAKSGDPKTALSLQVQQNAGLLRAKILIGTAEGILTRSEVTKLKGAANKER